MFRYYEGLQKCVGLYSENAQYSPDQIEQLDALYKSLRQQYSWSSAVKVIGYLFLIYSFRFSVSFFQNGNCLFCFLSEFIADLKP